jgi:hypothetical protein
MLIVYFISNLTIFCWGTLCLNGFREAFKYNALGDYTELNVDINTLLGLSIVNTLMIITNYSNIAFLSVLNSISMITLLMLNILSYQRCNDICYNFYSDNRFNYYYTFFMILPYIQLLIIFIILYQLHKKYHIRKFFTQTTDTSNLELITNEVE